MARLGCSPWSTPFGAEFLGNYVVLYQLGYPLQCTIWSTVQKKCSKKWKHLCHIWHWTTGYFANLLRTFVHLYNLVHVELDAPWRKPFPKRKQILQRWFIATTACIQFFCLQFYGRYVYKKGCLLRRNSFPHARGLLLKRYDASCFNIFCESMDVLTGIRVKHKVVPRWKTSVQW